MRSPRKRAIERAQYLEIHRRYTEEWDAYKLAFHKLPHHHADQLPEFEGRQKYKSATRIISESYGMDVHYITRQKEGAE